MKMSIFRTIDEAGIRQAETDRIVKMRQLEMEERSNFSRKTLTVAWIAATAILIFIGIIGYSINNAGMMSSYAILSILCTSSQSYSSEKNNTGCSKSGK